MNENPLGKKIEYIAEYTPSLLYVFPRKEQRIKNNINDVYFKGYDIWNAYEVSYLDNKGKPEVRTARIVYSSETDYIIESKSLKLYLGSLVMTKFNNDIEVKCVIEKDLKKILNTEFLNVELFDFSKRFKYSKIPESKLLDKLGIETNFYKYDKNLIRVINGNNKKTIIRYSNLLKTNCPVTNQPDWGSIYIKYRSSNYINDSSLLRYIISYREHKDFHESTCENIFDDIFEAIKPELLVVKCFYTRRGGIEINPMRYYGQKLDKKIDFHYWRQ